MATKIVNVFGAVDADALANLASTIDSMYTDDILKIRINSTGGEEHYALAMYDLIRRISEKGIPTIGRATGYCHSAATLVLLACDDRKCTRNTEFLFHMGDLSAENGEEFTQVIKRGQLWTALVAERAGVTMKRATQWHARETYMDSATALKWNIVREVL